MATPSITSSRPTRAAESAGASPIGIYLDSLLARHVENEEGAVATYIPELASVDPSLLGVSLVTVQGSTYEAGDTREPFTIQSISKPLTYGIALERIGAQRVHDRIGVEPSGDAFNEISLAPETGSPLNPMINAGAIACAGLIVGTTDDPFADLLATYSRYAGRQLSLDEAVYLSESETGHRNRAIGHMLRNFDVIEQAPEAALDLYFRQCAISVDCLDLATIAATLANGGVNPRTGERAVSEDVVREVLCVMATCGMYDYAGGWLISVGLPAKSGVSGGVLAVLPGQLGIAVFSPRLDCAGQQRPRRCHLPRSLQGARASPDSARASSSPRLFARRTRSPSWDRSAFAATTSWRRSVARHTGQRCSSSKASSGSPRWSRSGEASGSGWGRPSSSSSTCGG